MSKVTATSLDSHSTCAGGCSASKVTDATRCPESGTIGSKVELITVKALLRSGGLRRLDGRDYRYCPAPDCDVVYFDCASGSRLRKNDLVVRVGRKELEDPRPVCYCFDFTLTDLHNDLSTRGKTDIPERITEEIRAGHCACEVKNPEGSCCLGNVRDAVNRILSEMAGATSRP